MTSYSRVTATIGLSRTVSEIDGDFSRKFAKFSHPLYFATPLKGFPLELGTGAGSQKTRMMGLPGRQRSLTISSPVWIQCTSVTDRRTYTGPQQRKTALTHSVAR